MGNIELSQDIKVESGKGIIAVIGAGISAFTLNEWVARATLAYILVQTFILLEKRHWSKRDRVSKNNKNNKKAVKIKAKK